MDIASERKRLGLSQAAIAAQIGVNQTTLSRWEHGHLTPNSRDLIALRAAMEALSSPASQSAA